MLSSKLQFFRKLIQPQLIQRSNVRFYCMPGGDTKDVTFEDIQRFKDNKTIYVIDVREPVELKETGVIPGSINIPLNEVETSFKLSYDDFIKKYHRPKPTIDTPLVFSCKAGIRSQKALNIAQSLGFKKVHNYRGGWLDWEKHIKKT